MDEAALDSGEPAVEQVQHVVHDAVAHVGASRVRHERRDAARVDALNHGLDRQRGEIRGVAVLAQRGVEWLLAVVVGDAGFGQIDRDLLHGHGRTASGLTDAQHVIGLLAFDGLLDHHGAAREHGRNLQFDDAHARDGFGQQLDRFECGMDRLAAERIESGDQDLAHNGSFAWNIRMEHGVTGR